MRVINVYLFLCAMQLHISFMHAMDVSRSMYESQQRAASIINKEDATGGNSLYTAVCLKNKKLVEYFLKNPYVNLSCSALGRKKLEDIADSQEIRNLISSVREDRQMVLDLFADSFKQK